MTEAEGFREQVVTSLRTGGEITTLVAVVQKVQRITSDLGSSAATLASAIKEDSVPYSVSTVYPSSEG